MIHDTTHTSHYQSGFTNDRQWYPTVALSVASSVQQLASQYFSTRLLGEREREKKKKRNPEIAQQQDIVIEVYPKIATADRGAKIAKRGAPKDLGVWTEI